MSPSPGTYPTATQATIWKLDMQVASSKIGRGEQSQDQVSDTAGGYFYEVCQEKEGRRKAVVTVKTCQERPGAPLMEEERNTPSPHFTLCSYRGQAAMATHTLSSHHEIQQSAESHDEHLFSFFPFCIPRDRVQMG